MKQTKLLLTQIVENGNNPRTITPENLRKLIDSLLVFPKMLELRQLVLDKDNLILGGNMRFKALTAIFNMSDEETTTRIEKHAQKRNLDKISIEKLVSKWSEWRKKPQVAVTIADLHTDETAQFVIKDNVSSGDWNMDALENFDQDDLEEFGVQTWGSLDNLMDYFDTGSEMEERQRIIITYPHDRGNDIAQLLGLDELKKPNYKIEELTK